MFFSPQAVPGAGGEEGEVDAGRDLSGFRRALLLSFWLPFTAYAFGPWSPGGAADPKNFELVTTLCKWLYGADRGRL